MVLHRNESGGFRSSTTVTEQITGIDIVRSQILVAMDQPLHGKKIGIPQQEDIPRNGCAVQCRVTTEDQERIYSGLR